MVEVMSEPSQPVVRPVLVTTISQALSAGSNFVILLALGRASGAFEVGKYGLAFGVYNAALGLQRSMMTDPLLARPVGSTADQRGENDRALTCSIAIAALAALIVGVVGFATDYDQLKILALFLVLVLTQDACRYLLFRNSRHAVAVALDGLWFAGSCTSFVILRGHPGHGPALIIWGVSGSVAAVLGLLMLRFRPVRPSVAAPWWRSHLWPSSRWLTLEAGVFHADQQVVIFGFTAMAGATLFGKYQIAQSLVGLSVFVTTGIGVVAVARFSHRTDDQLREAGLVSLISFGCVALVTASLLALSGPIVRLLYGDKITIPGQMILATGASLAFMAAAGGMQVLLRARRTERILPIARAVVLLAFAPAAVIVSKHNFSAALWILVGESVSYLLILTWAAARTRARVGVVPEPIDVVV